jgi:hypothetical protein
LFAASFNTFFFLDEKETKSQDQTIYHAQAKLLRVWSGLRSVLKKKIELLAFLY